MAFQEGGMSDPTDPLWKKVWKEHGIRFLGRGNNPLPDAMERFEHAFLLGYKAGVMAQTLDFQLPEGAHVADMTWNGVEEERE
jgi:hypothetical protein